ncbi:MAG: NAD(P)/FAD-dependent oxidoreductase [Methylophilaceae bacterium]
MAKKIVVVGGGIMGSMTALELTHRGHAVTVVERNQIAAQTSGESSWAGAGIAFPLLPWFYKDEVNELALAGAKRYPQLAKTLYSETGIDPECIRSGMLIKPPFNQTLALDWCAKFSVEANLIGNDLLLAEVLQVRNPRLLQSLKAWLIKNGVKLVEQTQLAPLNEAELADAGKITGWRTSTGEVIEGDAYVVTSGAWSFELLKETSLKLNIKPMRGQILLYELPKQTLQHIVYQDGFYLVPRSDGHLLAGSTLEDVGFDTGVTEEMRQAMQAKAEAIMPSLKHTPIIKHWSGLRPGTPDNVPTIAQHPSIKNLYLNTGHFRYGVTMAPESARRLAELVG